MVRLMVRLILLHVATHHLNFELICSTVNGKDEGGLYCEYRSLRRFRILPYTSVFFCFLTFVKIRFLVKFSSLTIMSIISSIFDSFHIAFLPATFLFFPLFFLGDFREWSSGTSELLLSSLLVFSECSSDSVRGFLFHCSW